MNQNYLCRNYMVTYFHIEVTAINGFTFIQNYRPTCRTTDNNTLGFMYDKTRWQQLSKVKSKRVVWRARILYQPSS